MIRLTLFLALLFPISSVFAAEESEGGAKFVEICMACHKADRSPDMLAPPIFAVKNHYIRVYSDRESFVARVKQWLAKPDINQTLMPGAVRRFQVMPPLDLDPAQAEAIAGFIYDTNFNEPDWYQQHFQAEHGTN
ncbi:MAG: hypothetical protein C0631_00760 [Sedimenticola sp.]|nr:MAG: hypothetical protein C0631_00760 [Sedimenticola sp.]